MEREINQSENSIVLINSLIEKLVQSRYPIAKFGPDVRKSKILADAERKKLEFELSIITKNYPENLPEDTKKFGKLLWLKMNQYCHLPKSFHDEEVKHSYGVIQALATGVVKSFKYNKPLIEVHLTACPSYLKDDDIQKVDESKKIYIYQNINPKKVDKLKSFTGIFKHFGQFVKCVTLHTPAPEDMDGTYEYAGCFGTFQKGKEGKDSMNAHWKQMQIITSQLPGVVLSSDVSYIKDYINKNVVEDLTKLSKLPDAWQKFKSSDYINSAYTQSGANAWDVFVSFYLGSILAYGNHESDFSLGNDHSLKLYINLEEGRSPETFAGQSVGTDFRHLLSQKGHHLALMLGDIGLRTPWAGR